MTRDEAKRLLPVIQAFADGKDVEWCCKFEDGKPAQWRVCPEPSFYRFAEYRIKPEPLECWLVKDCEGDLSVHGSKDSADDRVKYGSYIPYTIHHMREVMP